MDALEDPTNEDGSSPTPTQNKNNWKNKRHQQNGSYKRQQPSNTCRHKKQTKITWQPHQEGRRCNPTQPRKQPRKKTTTTKPYWFQHRTGCTSHSKREQELAWHLSRNHFQAKSFTLSTTGSSRSKPPAKIRSFRDAQKIQITACQTRSKPNLTISPFLTP